MCRSVIARETYAPDGGSVSKAFTAYVQAGGRPGSHLFARNELDVPLRVTKVSVYECENIEGGCVEYDPNLVLQPHEKRRLYTVVPLLTSKAYRYRWRASSGAERVATEGMAVPVARAPSAGASSAGAPLASTPARPGQPAPTPAPGVDPSGAVSSGTGNPQDAVGATIKIDATQPGNRSVKSIVPPAKYRGRRMRLSADVAATKVFGGATIWIQTESPDGTVIAESSEATRVTGTNQVHLTVVMSIPDNATALTLALRLNGMGSVVATSFKFREVAGK